MSDLPDIRIGTAEREQALDLLSEHFAAGRLTVVEFDERSATARPTSTKPDGDHNWRRIVMSVIPLVALVLFFVVPVDNSWLFFLMIPAGGAILFGMRNDRERDR
jgi:uncharacterized membrane protein